MLSLVSAQWAGPVIKDGFTSILQPETHASEVSTECQFNFLAHWPKVSQQRELLHQWAIRRQGLLLLWGFLWHQHWAEGESWSVHQKCLAEPQIVTLALSSCFWLNEGPFARWKSSSKQILKFEQRCPFSSSKNDSKPTYAFAFLQYVTSLLFLRVISRSTLL